MIYRPDDLHPRPPMEDFYTGSWVPCRICDEGMMHAFRDGSGEVSEYGCDTCRTMVYLMDEMDPNNGTDYAIGSACALNGLEYWEFDLGVLARE